MAYLLLDCWRDALNGLDSLLQLPLNEVNGKGWSKSKQEDLDVNSNRTLKSNSKLRKSVSFSQNDIYLIPSRTELEKETLWYDATNIASFRSSTLQDVKSYMELTGVLDIRKALTHLYQPEFI
jgi:hypothetical protein